MVIMREREREREGREKREGGERADRGKMEGRGRAEEEERQGKNTYQICGTPSRALRTSKRVLALQNFRISERHETV